jgi:hypothetical protein
MAARDMLILAKRAICILINVTAFVCYMPDFSFAESVLVQGNIDDLPIVIHTGYLDNTPVILFSENQEKKGVDILDGIETIVLKDDTWQGLAVELLAQGVMVDDVGSTVDAKMPGNYEIYLEINNPQESIADYIGALEINQAIILLNPEFKSYIKKGKYIKIAEIEFDRGRHTLRFKKKILDGKNLRLIIVRQDQLRLTEQSIWNKINQKKINLSYIFEKDADEFWTE